MAITTYSELQTALAKWPGRENQAGWADLTKDFIALGEDYLNAELPLRFYEGDTTLTATIGSRSIALPSDYLEPYGLQHLSSPFEALVGRAPTPESIGYTDTQGRPSQWAIDETWVIFECPCDQAYSLQFRYRKKFALSDASPTNWLLTNHPRVYLYACLFEAGAFIDDGSDYQAKMRAMRDEAISSASRLAGRSKKIARLRVDSALLLNGRYDIESDTVLR